MMKNAAFHNKGNSMIQAPTVLVVDDENAYCEALRDVLEAAGAHVNVANNARAAEALFRLLVPDLVILDIMMAGMCGPELIGRLRAIMGGEHVPIVVASALVLKADRAAALRAGANAYLSKPFNSKELRAMVRRFLPLAKTGALTPPA
jgi:DNA-binding response OmpR family regulator